MKFKTDVAIKDMDGKDLTEKDVKGNESVVTYQKVFANSVLIEDGQEKHGSDEKSKRFKLALKLHGHGEVDLSNAECVLLKDQVAKFYSVLVTGQVCEFLEKPIAEAVPLVEEKK